MPIVNGTPVVGTLRGVGLKFEKLSAISWLVLKMGPELWTVK